jgi:hypothetical protein
MKFIIKISLCAALLLLANLAAFAQTTAFTYQGRLDNAGNPANGTYDLQFTLYDAAELGTAQGPTLATSGTVVTDGLFTVPLDFGDQFAGADRWLELGVRTHGGVEFTLLSPRQPLTPTPYAHYAPNAGTAASASSVNAANISGTIPLAQLPPDVVTNGASGVNISGTFSGDGKGLSSLNVSSLQQIQSHLAAWGSNGWEQTTIPVGLSNVVAIAAGAQHNLALQSDGTVTGWGRNEAGQATVPVGLSNVVAIAAGGDHSLALRSEGTVVAWGRNFEGQSTVPDGLVNVVAIAAGDYHSLVLQSDGTVIAWGRNSEGQTNVPVGLNDVVAIAAGADHSLVLQSDGTVIAWGRNSEGQTTVPVGLSNVVAIAAGASHSLVLQSDGTVSGWGWDIAGQTTVPVGLSNVVAIAAGAYHSLALQSDGTVIGWGMNSDGQTTVPVGLRNVVTIAAGFAHSLAFSPEHIPAPVALLSGNNNFQGSVTASNFAGDGAGLTALNASQITSGTLSDARLSSEVSLLGGSIESTEITNGTILNEDINAAAAIADTKLATLATPGKVADTALSTNVARRADENNFTGDQTFSGAVSVSNGISSSTGNSQFNFNGGYNDVTMTLRQRAGDNIALAVQDTATINRLLVTSGGVSVIGDITASGGVSGSGASLTGLNASQLTSGTLSDARLSGNVSLLGTSIESSEITNGTILNEDISAAAAIADTKLATLATPGKVANAATTATSANTPNGIVARDASGNFSAGTLTANSFSGSGASLTGLNASQVTNGTLSDARLSGNVSLLGGSIESAEITDGTILNADINAAAAIADTKLATLATPGKVADTALSTNVARRADGNTFTGDQTFSGQVFVSSGISSSTNNSRFNFNGGYGDVTMTLRQRAGDSIMLAVQDTETYNRLLVSSGGASVLGTFGVTGSIVASGTVTANGVLLTSDRNAKENFSPVDSQAVLAKVAALPLTEWRYKTDDQGVRHIGPMAQDFQAAFELSSDDTHISVVDQGGVALAAIQGLNEKVDSENDKLRAENADLKARLERLEQLLEDRLNEECPWMAMASVMGEMR